MPRKKVPKNSKYNKKVAAEICEMIKADMPLKAIQQTNPDRYGSPSTIIAWRKVHPEFAKMYNEAREIQATIIMEEYNYLVKNPPAPSDDKVRDSYNLKIWDSQVRALQFKIINLNKRFDPKTFSDTTTIEHKGLENLQGPQIVIANYAAPSDSNEKVIGSTYDAISDDKGGKK